ncbi:hypothetical protein DIPPA_25790 [Diplonema papillatum]|nr:hypothetical protein DIPPA_25790 [Diplonema papillatum]
MKEFMGVFLCLLLLAAPAAAQLCQDNRVLQCSGQPEADCGAAYIAENDTFLNCVWSTAACLESLDCFLIPGPPGSPPGVDDPPVEPKDTKDGGWSSGLKLGVYLLSYVGCLALFYGGVKLYRNFHPDESRSQQAIRLLTGKK